MKNLWLLDTRYSLYQAANGENAAPRLEWEELIISCDYTFQKALFNYSPWWKIWHWIRPDTIQRLWNLLPHKNYTVSNFLAELERELEPGLLKMIVLKARRFLYLAGIESGVGDYLFIGPVFWFCPISNLSCYLHNSGMSQNNKLWQFIYKQSSKYAKRQFDVFLKSKAK